MPQQVWIQPTREQQDQAVLVQGEICEAINRLAREGFDPRVIMAGIAAASSDLVFKVFGQQAVPMWFAKQAEITAELIGKGH